jgi:hypothetical protein
MTNYNERLDEALLMLTNAAYAKGNEAPRQILSGVPRVTTADTKQALTSLTKELVAEAKPEPTKYEKYNSDCLEGFNIAADEFEQNLLKALEEV